MEIADFMSDTYSFAAPYADPTMLDPREVDAPIKLDQFSDDMAIAAA